MANRFIRIKPCRMLLVLKDSQDAKYITELARESGATYVHTTKLIRKLENKGIVTTQINGKKRMVKLTEKGMKIASALGEVIAALE
jgi:predicted transcriptional regulator